MIIKCSCCGSEFSTANYLFHHLKIHSNIHGIVECSMCKKRCKTTSYLRKHIFDQHLPVKRRYQQCTGTKLCCTVDVCHEVIDAANLVTHLGEHVANGVEIECPFKYCGRKYKIKSSFNSHVYRLHKHWSEADFKCSSNAIEVKTSVSSSSPPLTDNKNQLIAPYGEISSISEPNEIYKDGAEMVGCNPAFQKSGLERALAMFYLRLESQNLVPSTTVQLIATEMANLSNLNNSILFNNIMNTISKLQLENEVKEAFSAEFGHDVINSVHGEEGVLRSVHMRMKYYSKNLQLVLPKTIDLGLNKVDQLRQFSYISIKKTLSVLLKNKEVQQQISTPQLQRNGVYQDIQDGAIYCDLVRKHGPSIFIMLYQDEFELCNPIGSSRTKHKLLAFYYCLGNLYSQNRSKVDNTQLVQLCKSEDIKEFGKRAVLSTLIEELKILETEGMEVNGIWYPVILHSITGDNLGAHFIGGFVENFSSVSHCCRFCTIKTVDIQKEFEYSDMRTPENYKAAIDVLDDSPNHIQGIKEESCFNDIPSFNVCRPGLPPCIAHDLLEGVASIDAFLCVQYFVKEKWFTYEDLNRLFKRFKFKGAESKIKPSPLSSNRSNLGGTASQNWTFLRFFPIVMQNFIADTNHYVWKLFLELRKIVQYAFATSISTDDVAYMNSKIRDYLYMRKDSFPTVKLRPKHHFMTHYGYIINQLGPLPHFSTLRFESKHQFFKRLIRSSSNFINVLQLLSMRHQLNQAYIAENDKFRYDNGVEYVHGDVLNLKIYSTLIKASIEEVVPAHSIAHCETTKRATICGTLYNINSFLIYKQHENTIWFGKIEIIICASQTVCYFLVEKFESYYDQQYGLYILSSTGEYECVPHSLLAHFYPLNAYPFQGQQAVSIKVQPLDIFSEKKMAEFNLEQMISQFVTVSADTLQKIKDGLSALGVDSTEDLAEVKEGELDDALPLIKRRRLVAAWKNLHRSNIPDETGERSNGACSSNSFNYSVTHQDAFILKSNLVKNWKMPLCNLQEDIRKKLELMKTDATLRLTIKQYRAMLRVIALSIHQIVAKPGRAVLSKLSEKITNEYKGLADFIGNDKFGSGYASIAKKIEERIDNLNRGEKSRPEEKIVDTNKRRLSIGCTQFCPETDASSLHEQELKLTELKILYSKKNPVQESVLKLMKDTYSLQRQKLISSASLTKDVRDEIPYLFNLPCFFIHFETLTGVPVSKFQEKLVDDKKLFYDFFKGVVGSELIEKIEQLKNEFQCESIYYGHCFLLIVAKYFKEPVDEICIVLPETLNVAEIQEHPKLPLSPCIVLLGDLYNPVRLFVSVDKVIVFTLEDHAQALLTVFCSFYVFNVEYPSSCGATLEFLQRCVAGINPEKGSRIKATLKRRRYEIHPKVLTLTRELGTFRSLEH